MQFTYRNPARSTDPSATLAGVRSLVVGARRYDQVRPPRPTEAPVWARVARYATADHYRALRGGLDRVADRLRADGWQARVLVDDNALVDRAAAQRAGLGWYGKNANVLVPGRGQLVGAGLGAHRRPLLAGRGQPVADGCGACTPVPRAPARPGPSWLPGWSMPAGAWPGWCRPRASSRPSTGWRWAIASTAATTARRCARPTGASARLGAAADPGRQAGSGSTWSSCWRPTTRPCWPGSGAGTSPSPAPVPAPQRPGGAGQLGPGPAIPRVRAAVRPRWPIPIRWCGPTPCGPRAAWASTTRADPVRRLAADRPAPLGAGRARPPRARRERVTA